MTTDTEEHKITIIAEPGRYHRSCSCGYEGMPMSGEPRPGLAERPCPDDRTVVGLRTLQMSWGGLLDSRPADDYAVHLVRVARSGGTPGPTLCGVDRFGSDAPGWSVGGGIHGPSIIHKPCPGCATVAREQFPGLPVSGSVGGKEMAAHLEVPYGRN